MRPCRHPDDRLPAPGQPWVEGAGVCRACWLFVNDPAYRAHWGGEQAPTKPWPWAARLVAGLRAAGDRGIGDTIARHLDRLGADAFKRYFKRLTGRDCGCGDRQAALNRLYPYEN